MHFFGANNLTFIARYMIKRGTINKNDWKNYRKLCGNLHATPPEGSISQDMALISEKGKLAADEKKRALVGAFHVRAAM
ncbi:MAG: hypothetical protein EPN73_10870 [Paraburkholderia sp.]|uniref:hypothetical protein n=1 Tax=Paraburkholderia sp. TaxID=1926495 RepID=UPI00122B1CFD|nr:hypothetical protein [Paraburkholderia sp.]TAL96421.1 MAG: hypothetical protein EPN73_10870 [Paraburkholderia sp.]